MRGSRFLKSLLPLGVNEQVFAMLAQRRGIAADVLDADLDQVQRVLLRLDAREWVRISQLAEERAEVELRKFMQARPQGLSLALLKLHLAPIADTDLLALLQRRGVYFEGESVPARFVDEQLIMELTGDARALADIANGKARREFLDLFPEYESLQSICRRLSHTEDRPLPDSIMREFCESAGLHPRGNAVARGELRREYLKVFALKTAIRMQRAKR